MPTNEDKMFNAANQMNPADIREFDRNVPPSVSRDIVKDNAKSVHFPSTPGETPGLPNWVDPLPLGPPPGIALVDKIAAHFAMRDKVQLARELGVKLPEEPPKDAA